MNSAADQHSSASAAPSLRPTEAASTATTAAATKINPATGSENLSITSTRTNTENTTTNKNNAALAAKCAVSSPPDAVPKKVASSANNNVNDIMMNKKRTREEDESANEESPSSIGPSSDDNVKEKNSSKRIRLGSVLPATGSNTSTNCTGAVKIVTKNDQVIFPPAVNCVLKNKNGNKASVGTQTQSSSLSSNPFDKFAALSTITASSSTTTTISNNMNQETKITVTGQEVSVATQSVVPGTIKNKRKKKKKFSDILSGIMTKSSSSATNNKEEDLARTKERHKEMLRKQLGGGTFRKVDKI